MKEILKWLFIETHAKWVFVILIFELWLAMNISPTILTDYPFANSFAEMMAFIPAVHAFDGLALHPESTRFFIAMSFFLLIPKSIAVFIYLQKNPHSEMSQYVITPYTTTKPSRALRVGEDLTEEEAKKLLTVKRSMFSRLVWSLLSLGLVGLSIMICLLIGETSERDLALTKGIHLSLIKGGFSMWFTFSIFRLTFCALLIAVAFFIIKDYFRLFIDITKKFFRFIF